MVKLLSVLIKQNNLVFSESVVFYFNQIKTDFAQKLKNIFFAFTVQHNERKKSINHHPVEARAETTSKLIVNTIIYAIDGYDTSLVTVNKPISL